MIYDANDYDVINDNWIQYFLNLSDEKLIAHVQQLFKPFYYTDDLLGTKLLVEVQKDDKYILVNQIIHFYEQNKFLSIKQKRVLAYYARNHNLA